MDTNTGERQMNIEQTINELAVGCLPKWPQMLVSGKPVTVEQAKDIILRTDRFLTDADDYAGGNAREFNRYYREMAGLTQIQKTKQYPEGHSYITADWDLQDKVKDALGVIETEYVRNDWASCSFIGGPHGWCHPDGTIHFDDNVGKWPSIEEIFREWGDIAQEFPYLDLHVTLMSGESCDDYSRPVINIRVVNGEATLAEPDDTVHSYQKQTSEDKLEQFVETMRNFGTSREIGLPAKWYEEFAERVRTAVATVL